MFEFKLRACSDALLELRPDPRQLSQFKLQLLIGTRTNMFTVLNIVSVKGKPVTKQISTPKILNCDIYRRFWIRWGNGFITFGRGKVNTNNIFSELDPYKYDIPRALSLGSQGQGHMAEWEFNRVAGNLKYFELNNLRPKKINYISQALPA